MPYIPNSCTVILGKLLLLKGEKKPAAKNEKRSFYSSVYASFLFLLFKLTW